jgi:hypothetical protein
VSAVDLAAWVPRQPTSPAITEGFCPYGHGPLEVVELHGKPHGACRPCGCSWRVQDHPVWGRCVWGCACVPGDHTCGEGSLA